MSTTKTIDDQDPSVEYSAGWHVGTSTSAFDNTTSRASSAGLTASLNFTGIGIKVLGTIQAADVGPPPMSSYTIDSSPPQNFTGVQMPSSAQQKIMFFESTALPNRNHSLVVTSLKTGAALILDYFVVILENPASTTVSSSNVLSPTATTPSETSNPTDTSASTSSADTHSNALRALTITTTILGGMFILSLISFMILRYRRRRSAVWDDQSPTRSGRVLEINTHLNPQNLNDDARQYLNQK
ncbi:hypothetical protein CVT26_007843 [Gymnopilus dilepis]|uniref:Uncharacterized protein n=1 Tax=Gymnopilus dilepis TaxID=231916 RepID=A0A409W7U8_9AGAR|nr:hypothetical protein CVT26_007843 [Gymnopilus dilepis]